MQPFELLDRNSTNGTPGTKMNIEKESMVAAGGLGEGCSGLPVMSTGRGLQELSIHIPFMGG